MSEAADTRGLRRQRDVLAVQALTELLKRVCAEPASHLTNQALVTALKSQGALAKYYQSDPPIHGMSLNHQKAIAEQLSGGYEVLNGLRRSAIDVLAAERLREKRGNTVSKAGLRIRVRELEKERAVLLEDMMLLQRAFDLRCIQAREYASNADISTQVRCTKEQREIDIGLSLRRRPAPKTNVVSLVGAKIRDRT